MLAYAVKVLNVVPPHCTAPFGALKSSAKTTTAKVKVNSNHFGPIPGVEVGMCWKYRMQIFEVGLHRQPVAGVAGRAADGCYSIVLAGAYEDDEDHGDEFTYTGSGGKHDHIRLGSKRISDQSAHQELTRTNLAIAASCDCPVDEKKGGKARDWQKGNSALEDHDHLK